MPRHVIDTASWNRTNMLPGSKPNEYRTRPAAYRHVIAEKRMPVGGAHTIRPQQDDMVRHYRVTTDGSDNTYLYGYTEHETMLCASKQLGQSGHPEVVTWALVDNILFCASPSFATQYIYPSGGAFEAVSEDILDPSGNVLLPSLPVPRGVCVEFGGRLVIASDDILYFSDPGRPFTWLSSNAVDPPGGSIRGLHVSGGSLVVCTTNGVYLLPQEAAQRADVFGAFQRVSDYRCLEYGHTVEHDGVVWGVSRRGVTSVYPSGADIDVNQSSGAYAYKAPFEADNWQQEARMVNLLDLGVGMVARGRDAFFLLSPTEGFGSWHYGSSSNYHLFDLRAVTKLGDGDLVFWHDNTYGAASSSWPWRFAGNRSTFEATVRGGLSGGVREHTVDRSPVLRKVQVAGGVGGDGSLYFAHQGADVRTSTPPARGVVAGTSEWGDGTALEELEVRSREFTAAYRSDDHQLEFGLSEPDQVLRTDVTLDFHGIGKRRTTN